MAKQRMVVVIVMEVKEGVYQETVPRIIEVQLYLYLFAEEAELWT